MLPPETAAIQGGTIWLINLDEPAALIQPLVTFTFCRAGPESISALAEAMQSGSSAEILHRFETGRRCFTAQVAGQLAAYGWVSLEEESIGELGLHLQLLPGEAYIWDCATLPAFRLKHLYSALLAQMHQELRTENLCRIWIGTNMENEASQKGIARAGFHHIADLIVERMDGNLGFQVQGRPGIPENLVADACRVFLGDRNQVCDSPSPI